MDRHEWTACSLTHAKVFLSSPPFCSTRGNYAVCEANASWCVYNHVVIKLIYDEKTRDGVADNFITSMSDSREL